MLLAGGKNKALMLKYETDKNLGDKQALAKEADDIWDLFRIDVERAGFNSAIISANGKQSGGPIQTNQSYNFVFEKDAQAQWRCLNDKIVTIGTPAKSAYRQALQLLAQGRYRDALAYYDKSIGLDAGYAQAYVDRGGVYLLLHQPDKALGDLSKAISLNPDSAEAYLNRGGAYGELKQYQKAIEDCTRAISLSATNPVAAAGAYANRGESYVEVGQNEKAIDDLTKAIASHPKPAEAYYYRAMAYEKLGKKDLASKDRAKAKELGYREGTDTSVTEGH